VQRTPCPDDGRAFRVRLTARGREMGPHLLEFHRRGTARLSTELADAIGRVRAGASRCPVPVLVLHGGADRMVPPEGSRRFVAAAPLDKVRMIEYPGGYHALLADIDGERVLADLTAWLVEHL